MAIAMLGIFSGCSKDDDDDDCELTQAGLQGSYKITGVSYKPDAVSPAEDEYATWDACQKDNLVILSANFQGSYSDAGVQCTPPQDETATWMYNSSTNQLMFQALVVNFTGDVENFSCSGMTVSITGSTPGEVTKITFAKQ